MCSFAPNFFKIIILAESILQKNELPHLLLCRSKKHDEVLHEDLPVTINFSMTYLDSKYSCILMLVIVLQTDLRSQRGNGRNLLIQDLFLDDFFICTTLYMYKIFDLQDENQRSTNKTSSQHNNQLM